MKTTNNNNQKNNISGQKIAKFAFFSILGVLLFMLPIPTADGAFNIPLGFVIDALGSIMQTENIDLRQILLLIFLSIAVILPIITKVFKLETLSKNKFLSPVVNVSIINIIVRAIAAFIAFSVFAGFTGEGIFILEEILHSWTAGVMVGDVAVILVPIFIVLAFAIPILTKFGAMEFAGVLIKKVVRKLFTLPGRSSIDLFSSWFGSSSASVIITTEQHKEGFYSDREAAAICVNFSMVSVPFSFVIASTMGIERFFPIWYVIISITSIILAVILPRIWPLRNIKDTFIKEIKREEDIPTGKKRFAHALETATERAEKTTFKDVITNALEIWANIFFDMIPIIVAIGSITLAVVEFTNFFSIIGTPFGFYLELFGLSSEYAPAMLTGFIDVFIPALTLTDATLQAQFIIGALSVVQIIYLTEVGVLILKSKIPLNVLHLLVIFLMRTILALPIIFGLTWIFTNIL